VITADGGSGGGFALNFVAAAVAHVGANEVEGLRGSFADGGWPVGAWREVCYRQGRQGGELVRDALWRDWRRFLGRGGRRCRRRPSVYPNWLLLVIVQSRRKVVLRCPGSL